MPVMPPITPAANPTAGPATCSTPVENSGVRFSSPNPATNSAVIPMIKDTRPGSSRCSICAPTTVPATTPISMPAKRPNSAAVPPPRNRIRKLLNTTETAISTIAPDGSPPLRVEHAGAPPLLQEVLHARRPLVRGGLLFGQGLPHLQRGGINEVIGVRQQARRRRQRACGMGSGFQVDDLCLPI